MLSLGNGRTLELIAKARTPEKGGKKIQSTLFMENCSLFWTENKDLSRAFGCLFFPFESQEIRRVWHSQQHLAPSFFTDLLITSALIKCVQTVESK